MQTRGGVARIHNQLRPLDAIEGGWRSKRQITYSYFIATRGPAKSHRRIALVSLAARCVPPRGRGARDAAANRLAWCAVPARFERIVHAVYRHR